MTEPEDMGRNTPEAAQPSDEDSPSALDEFFAEYYKSRFVYLLNERIKRARKFISEGAYIDEALQKYNLSDDYLHAFLTRHPDSVRPAPYKDDEFSTYNEVMRYLKMPSPD